MLGVNAADSRFLDDGEDSEPAPVPERTQRRAQPMSLAQLLAAKRAALSASCGPREEQQRPVSLPYERITQAASLPRPLPRAVDYSALQLRLVEQRERLRNESAAVIQRYVRRYQHRCYVRQCRALLAVEYDESLEPALPPEESEQELFCESVLVLLLEVPAVDMEIPHRELVQPSLPSPPIRDVMTPVSSYHAEREDPLLPVLPPAPPPLVTGERFPEYLVDVQLMSARGLLSESAMFAGGVVDLDLSLCSADGKAQIKCAATQVLHPQLTTSNSAAETVMTTDTSIQFTGGKDAGIADPQAIINEWCVHVVAKVRSARGRETQGNLNVPLVLLETGLASEYSLCRWFPLEKANPGDLTRGELRLSIRFLARALDATGCEIMAPYTPPKLTNAVQLRNDTASRIKSGRKPSPSWRVKQQPPSATNRAKRQTDPSTNPDRSLECSQSPDKHVTRAVTPPSPDRGRIPRAEAISPPSSPASTSSSDMMTSPIPTHQLPKPTPRPYLTSTSQQRTPPSRSFKSPERRVSLADRVNRLNATSARTRSASPTRGDSPGQSDDDLDDDSKPKRPFLKRKPYKVVFQRLDWSSVPSKTDSRLGTTVALSNDKPLSMPRQYQSQAKAVAGKSGPGGSLSPTGNLNDDPRARNDEESSARIDPMTRQRLKQLELAMHECCGVSGRSASLVHLRYQTERKKFAVAQAKRIQEMHPDADKASASSVEELWQRLASDATGEFYAERLNALSSWAEEAEM